MARGEVAAVLGPGRRRRVAVALPEESHDQAPTLQPTFTESSTQVPCTHKHGNLDLQLYLEHDPTADCHLVVAAAVALVVHLVLLRPVPRPVEVLLVVPSEL